MFEEVEINLKPEAKVLSGKIRDAGIAPFFEFIVESHLPVLNLFHSLLIFTKPILLPIFNPSTLDVFEQLLTDSDFREEFMGYVKEPSKGRN